MRIEVVHFTFREEYLCTKFQQQFMDLTTWDSETLIPLEAVLPGWITSLGIEIYNYWVCKDRLIGYSQNEDYYSKLLHRMQIISQNNSPF